MRETLPAILTAAIRLPQGVTQQVTLRPIPTKHLTGLQLVEALLELGLHKSRLKVPMILKTRM